MKVLSTVGILLTLISSYASAQNKWDLNGERLWGPVHTVQIEFTEISTVEGKEVVSRRRLHQKIVYDRSGNEIERINFNEDGSIKNRTVHIIDAKGRIAGWEEYEPMPNAKGQQMASRSEWIYDEKGNRIKACVYRQGILSHLTTASYDTAGHLIEEIMVTDNGEWKQTKKLDYDSGGRLVKTVVDMNGTIELMEQSYDSTGNLVRTKYSRPHDQDSSEVVFSYDTKGREIERTAEDSISKFKLITSYDTKGRVSKKVTQFEYKQPNILMSHAPEPGTVEFRYNDNDQGVEETAYSPEGSLLRKTVSDYDSAGRLRSQVYRNGDEVTKVSYEYDRFGNRVKKITPYMDWAGKSLVNVEHRIISYYNGR